MPNEFENYYKIMPGRWQLDCACGELQVYTFNADFSYEVTTFPKGWKSRTTQAIAGKQRGIWHLTMDEKGSYSQEQLNLTRMLAGNDWVNPEKVLWFQRGEEPPGLDAKPGWSLKQFIDAFRGLFEAAIDTDKCGAAFVTFIDEDTINIRMKSPCGGVLRRVPLAGTSSRDN